MIVDLAYFINTSDAYQRKKRFFYNLLENSSYKYKKYFDIFMITLIFASVVILIREVKSHVNDDLLFFNNYIVSIIFFIEYMLRLWISSSVTQVIIDQSEHDVMLGNKFKLLKAIKDIIIAKFKYILSIKAIIDLLAIIPFFHQLRLLRIFILFRVFKLFRYAKSIQTFTSVISAKKFEFFTLLIFASIIIFVSSVLIYVMEANNPDSPIDTLFEAVYWSIVTISTVGFGDIVPVTQEGRVVAMFVIVAGIGVFSFTTSLIVTSFTEKLDEIKDLKVIDDISKLKEFYLICGYENVSKEVAKKLSLNNKVIIMEEDFNKSESAKKDGFISLNYDPGSIESYKKLNINIETQVKAILCLSHSDVENVYTALTVRSFNKDVFILSILINKMNRNKLNFAGVNELFYEKELVGIIAKEFVGQPVAFEAIHALRTNYNGIDVQEMLVSDRVLESFVTVGQLENKKYRIILLGIYKKVRKRFFFNPIDSTVLEVGDYLLVIGNTQFLKEFSIYLHKKGSNNGK
ncbi:potassium channel protein 1 [Sulfurimonas gotlandica GD1]|uniref:BK channel n=1 Tax=Sulfurimonas gotlandica (strain DSM 19862 / JCM 16533 / GD1) TaxID=929558 RepID=B6BMN9_SULGG|nr:TrkA-N:Ion transport protein [Sulfurimonas gotlandica GD1]EHP30844.1 potassium channel protein 1 [Sulfurimonas gotlandica GD1]